MASSLPTAGTAACPRYAVVLKTYMWDNFVERQARRCAALTTGNGDFYISVDETQGVHQAIPFDHIVRTNNAELVTMGFAERLGERNLLWWNPDYAHYHFQETSPEYDFYVFLEYDAAYSGDFGTLVQSMSAARADVAILPLKEPKSTWCWTEPHLPVYPFAELQGSLICISAYSNHALKVLAERRRAMREEPAVTYWPSAEVFIPTEGRRCGLRFVSLEDFGDVTHLNWRPPHPEEWIKTLPERTFVHPVYDRDRYIKWALAQGVTMRSLLAADGPVRVSLSRLPLASYLPQWAAAVARCFVVSASQRFINLLGKPRTPEQRSS